MPRQVLCSPTAWAEYLYWQGQDAKTLIRINALIRDCQHDPFRGIGKPEPLRGQYGGCWSRRINDAHRLIYRVTGDNVELIACRYHYGAR